MASPLDQPAADTDVQQEQSERNGFECEFVEPPPEQFIQTQCPVCNLVIRDPHQATCCGSSFCSGCIKRIEAEKKPCPMCKEEKFRLFVDKRLKRSLYAIRVYCSNQKDGCEWTGELGQLDKHLDTCLLTSIDCDLLSAGCARKIPRKDMPEHLKEDLIAHMSLLARSHAKQQAMLNKQEDQLDDVRYETYISTGERIEDLDKACEALHTLVRSEIVATRSLMLEELAKLDEGTLPTVPHDRTSPTAQNLTMTNFQQYVTNQRDVWYSPPVYTHNRGYKICLAVSTTCTGTSIRTHQNYLSVFVKFMKGDFDDSLEWPFQGVITFRLMDQVNGVDHKGHLVVYFGSDWTLVDACSRVIEGEMSEGCRGNVLFLPFSELDEKYLKNDTLVFQVTASFIDP